MGQVITEKDTITSKAFGVKDEKTNLIKVVKQCCYLKN